MFNTNNATFGAFACIRVQLVQIGTEDIILGMSNR